MTKPRTAEQAIDYVAALSKSGPPFDTGLCKRKTREAYNVPSDGSDDATEAWSLTRHRIDVPGDKAPRGAILWWTGGSAGHGHAAIADGKGGVWSVDIKRNGFWDHVPFAVLGDRWRSLHFAGVSRDIDGVTVIPEPVVEKPKPAVVPTWFDLTVALGRFAAKSTNPVARRLLLSAAKTIGPFVTDGNRVHVPATVADVIYALKVKRKSAVGAAAKARITAAITLLSPVK